MNTTPILLIEDASSLQQIYAAVLRNSGYEVECARTLAEARAKLPVLAPDVILLDLTLPDGDGMELVAEAIAAKPLTKVIVITANGSVYRAVEAMRAGAFDILLKPIEEQHLLNVVMNARAEARMVRGDAALPPTGFIGTSDAITQVAQTVRRVAGSTATVFITGESGSSKEACARAVHALSNRALGPFVHLSCTQLPGAALDKALFGDDSLVPARAGAAIQADSGTLYLEEICDCSLRTQTRLLAMLQSAKHTGPDGVTRPINMRLICSTARDPLEEVRAGRLRADLYYRLHVLPVEMPPLRNRRADIMPITNYLIASLSDKEGLNPPRLSPEVVSIFKSHPWPGNIHQLRNLLWNLVVVQSGSVITEAHLPADFLTQISAPAGTQISPEDAIEGLLGLTLADVERRLIERTLAEHNGSVPLAARALGLSPSTVYRKLEHWGQPASRRMT